jgi:hypothetical protein
MVHGLCGHRSMEDDLHDVARVNLAPQDWGRLRYKYRTFIAIDLRDNVSYLASQDGANFVLRKGKMRLFHSRLSRQPAYLGRTRNTHRDNHDVPLTMMAPNAHYASDGTSLSPRWGIRLPQHFRLDGGSISGGILWTR